MPEGDEENFEELDAYLEKLMKESLPSADDEAKMFQDLEAQLKLLVENMEKTKANLESDKSHKEEL